MSQNRGRSNCDWQQTSRAPTNFDSDDWYEKKPKAERRLDSWRPLDWLQAHQETKNFPHLNMAQVKKQSARTLYYQKLTG